MYKENMLKSISANNPDHPKYLSKDALIILNQHAGHYLLKHQNKYLMYFCLSRMLPITGCKPPLLEVEGFFNMQCQKGTKGSRRAKDLGN